VKSPLAAGAEANFVQMLVDNQRLALLPEIAEQFDALKNEREGAPTPRSSAPSRWTARSSTVSSRPRTQVRRKLNRGRSRPVADRRRARDGRRRSARHLGRARLASMQAALTA
jgi:F-type H+-transporting ATPase subunit delta